MEHNIYEEMYEHLLSEGLEEDIATSVVNRMYEREELHDVEYIDEGLFRAATAIGKMMLNGPGKNLAAQIGTGAKATRATGYATMRQGQNLLNLPKSAAMTRRGLRAGWTPGKALPAGTPAGIRDSALKNLTKGSKSKSGGLVAPGKGGPLKTTGKTAGLGPVSKVEPVTVKDLGGRMSAGKNKAATAAAGSKGSGITYQGTRSGGQLPGKDVKALPAAGQTSTRRNLAQQKLDAAAKGSSSVGTRYSSQGVRQLGPEKLSSKVKRTISNIRTAVAGAGAATVKGAKKGASVVNKLPRGAKLAGGAALVGLAAAGLGVKDPLAKKTGELNLPKDTAPTTPPGGALADKKDDKNPSMVPGGTKGTDFTIPTSAWKPSADKEPNVDSSKKTREQELADIRAQAKADTIAKGKKKPYDIRDRDITARAQYDPRLKSERERMKRIKAERRAAKDLKKMRAESLERQGRLDEAKVLRYEIDQMNKD